MVGAIEIDKITFVIHLGLTGLRNLLHSAVEER